MEIMAESMEVKKRKYIVCYKHDDFKIHKNTVERRQTVTNK